MNRRYCLALDLKDNPELIEKYIDHHKKVWPEIIDSIKQSGIVDMEIYHTGDRLFMIMEVDDSFDFEKKRIADENNEKVREWEKLMWEFQKPLPWAEKGEKWIQMDQIFKL